MEEKMKKQSKIIAILLTLCLTIGAIAVFASAAVTATTPELDATKLVEGSTGITSLFTYSGANAVKNPDSSVSTTSLQTMGGNSYSRIEKPSKGVAATKNSTLKTVTPLTADNTDYIVLSFDIGADKYAYLDDETKTYMLSEDLDGLSESEKASAYPAYPHGYDFAMFNSAAGKAVITRICVDDKGVGYLTAVANKTVTSSTEKTVPLSNIINHWDNVTVIVDFNNSKTYYYLNGELVITSTYSLSEIATVRVRREWLDDKSGTLHYKAISGAVDNLCAYTFTKGYTSDGYNGIDDFFAGKLSSIVECEDMVYNTDYFYAGSNNGYEIVSDGKAGYHHIPYTAKKVLKAGDVVYTKGNINAILPEGFDYIVGDGESDNAYVIYKEGEAHANISSNDISTGAITTTTGTDKVFNGNVSYNYNGNSCLRVYSKDNLTASTSYSNNNKYYWNYAFSEKVYPSTSNAIYNYISYDIAAIDYQYIPDGATDGVYRILKKDLSELSDAEKATVRLSYMDGISGAFLVNQWDAKVYIVSNGNKWYLSMDKTYGEEDLPLADEIGEWNRISAIVNFKNKNIDFYLGEQYLGTNTVTGTKVDRVSPILISGVNHTADFNMVIDNIMSTAYTLDYASPAYVFGIDDYIALEDKTLPISFIEDIDFNAKFETNTIEKSIELKHNGKIYKFYNLAQAISAATSGDELLYDGLKIYRPLAPTLATLKVSADTVLIGEATKMHTLTDGVISVNPFYFVNWCDSEGNVIATNESDITSAPNYNAVNLALSDVKGNYLNNVAWNYSIGADGEQIAFASWDASAVEIGDNVYMYPVTGKVTWYKNDKTTVLAEELWYAGSTASRDFSELEEITVLDNGWYEVNYYWNSKTESFDISKGDEREYKPVKIPESALDIKFNYYLGSVFYPAYYIPAEIDGVNITKATYANGINTDNYVKDHGAVTSLDALKQYLGSDKCFYDMTDSYEVVEIGGESYYKFANGSLSVFAIYNMSGIQIEFTAVIDEIEYTLTSAPALTTLAGTKSGAVSYAARVFGSVNSAKKCSDDVALLYNWLQYINYSYAMQSKDGVFAAEVSNLLNAHKSLNPFCTCQHKIEDMVVGEAPAGLTYGNFSEVEGLNGISATYYITHSYGRVGIYVPKAYVDEVGADNIKLTVKFKGIGELESGNLVSGLTVTHEMEMLTSSGTPNVFNGTYLYLIDNTMKPYNLNE